MIQDALEAAMEQGAELWQESLRSALDRAELAEARLATLREAARRYREVAEHPSLDTIKDVARDDLDAALRGDGR